MATPAYTLISGAGTPVGGTGGSGGTGLPPGSGTPPGNVSAITVSGFMDPVSGTIMLTVGVTPPSPLGNFIGCEIWLEIPDQSSGTPFVVGAGTVGGTDAVTGPWSPDDLGRQPYVGAQQPWTLIFPVPPGINPNVDTPCRLYAVSYTSVYENPVVQANQPGASPNQTFTLASLASGSPTSGENITTLHANGSLIKIVALVEGNDNSTGKLQTPVLVTINASPTTINGWSFRFVVTLGNADPTNSTNWQITPGVFTQAGPCYYTQDGIPVPHTFLWPTPTTIVQATVWLQAGLVDANGNYQWNNVVPGITPGCPITFGTENGVTDASQVMLSTINSAMAVVAGQFGVAASGITNPFLGPGAVATINVQNLAVTNPLLAALSVQAANMAASSITISNSALAPLAVAATNMAVNSVTASNDALAAAAVVATNLAGSSVTATAIAVAAVGTAAIATAAVGSAAIAALAVGTAAIQSGAITNALIANLAVSGAQIQSATITGANIGYATIAYGNIGSCSVSSLLAGTAYFSGTATFAYSVSGPSVVIDSGTVHVYSVNGSTSSPYVAIASTQTLFAYSSSNYVSITASGVQVIGGGVVVSSTSITPSFGQVMVAYSLYEYVSITGSGVLIVGGGITISPTAMGIVSGQATIAYNSSNYVGINSSGVGIIQAGGYPYGTSLALTSSGIAMTVGSYTVFSISSAGVLTLGGSSAVNVTSMSVNSIAIADALIINLFVMNSTSASGGSYTPPSTVAGYIPFSYGATTYKIPYHNA